MGDFEQQALSSVPRFHPLSALIDDDGVPATIVVGCGQTKSKRPSSARRLYTSARFQTACTIAESLSAPLYILSGLHGVVLPSDNLEPYDLNLASLDKAQHQTWLERVKLTLQNLPLNRKVCILATDPYAHGFITAVHSRQDDLLTVAPLISINENLHGNWYKQALAAAQRFRDLRRLYEDISKARILGRTFLLGDLTKQKLPKRGVYIFLDTHECNFYGTPGRIVRVGTHAISLGSKSTLRLRLRNHLGPSDGNGNHRGSIFRLHIGRALLEKDGTLDQLSNWGKGRHASSETRMLEREHEIRVSNYLSRLEVYILEIEDPPTKNSLRASVERQLIALCTESLEPIDRVSESWLGRYSPMQAIAKSGLWNLRDVGRQYEPEAIGSVTNIFSLGTDR